MIENKFLYFQTYEAFKAKLNEGLIDEGSVAFIGDESIIWTHGKEFNCNVPISEQFGDGVQVAVSQKALTAAIDSIWNKIEDMTGESLHGIHMTVSPEYYVSESGCDVTISISKADISSIFEIVKFYVNDELITTFTNENDIPPFETHVNGTSIIKCEAQILGVTYTDTRKVIYYPGFWLGAATNYTDVMNIEHLVDITNGIRTNKDVVFNSGDYLFIIIDNTILNDFIRVDMNGFEIPLEDGITISNGEYTYFKSKSPFQAGTYNIDING